MQVSLKGRNEIRQYIRAIPNTEWPARVRTLLVESSQALGAGEIDDATYEVWGEEIVSRQERHASKAIEHDRFEGEVSTFSGMGSAITTLVGAIPTPRSSTPDQGTDCAVRGPSRHTAAQRFERRFKSRVQAGMAKLPARIKGYFTMSQLAAFSVIIHRASKHAGICEMAVGSIAGISAVSARTVQDAVAIGKHAKLITVHEQEGAPNIIRIVDPRILERFPDSGNGSYPSFPKSKNSSTKSEIKSPRMGANFCLNVEAESPEAESSVILVDRHTPKVARLLPDAEPVPVAPVQDEAEEIRQEAVEVAAVVMERAEAQSDPDNPLEAALAKFGAMVAARNTPS